MKKHRAEETRKGTCSFKVQTIPSGLIPALHTQKKSIASCDGANHTNVSWSRQIISNKDCVSVSVCAHVMGN